MAKAFQNRQSLLVCSQIEEEFLGNFLVLFACSWRLGELFGAVQEPIPFSNLVEIKKPQDSRRM